MLERKIESKTKFSKTLHGHAEKHPPIWLMRQAGRYLPEYLEVRKDVSNFLNFCYNPELACKVTLQPIDRFEFDAAIIFSDILVIPDSLGIDVAFKKGEGPVLKFDGNLESLQYHAEKLQPVYDAISLTRSKLSDDKSLIGFAGSPWTLATYVIEGGGSRDFAKTKTYAYSKPKEFLFLIDVLADAVTKHLIAQIEAGADVLQLFDSWAGVLPEDEYYKWVINPTAKIISKVKEVYPDVPIIGFPKGSGLLYKNYSIETGVDALSFDHNLPIQWAVDNLSLPLQGNLDPLLLASDKDRALSQAKKILDITKGRPFIFNLGHGIVPQTPVENVNSLVDFVRN